MDTNTKQNTTKQNTTKQITHLEKSYILKKEKDAQQSFLLAKCLELREKSKKNPLLKEVCKEYDDYFEKKIRDNQEQQRMLTNLYKYLQNLKQNNTNVPLLDREVKHIKYDQQYIREELSRLKKEVKQYNI